MRFNISPDHVRAARERLQAVLAETPWPGAWPDRSTACLPVEGKACLRYYPATTEPVARPLLLVYSLVNRPQVLDIGPDDSFIRRLQGLGHPVYLMDWGRPDAADASVSLADYVCGYLRCAVSLVRQHQAAGRIDLLGICQGGGLALCLASIEPHMFHRLVTLVTAVDFHTPGDVLTRLARALDLRGLLAPDGNVPGHRLAGLFERLRPLRVAAAKRSPLPVLLGAPCAERERLLRLLAWQGDYPDQAGRAWLEWITACYRENALVNGTLVLDGRPVDLRRLRLPILNVYARDDHLVPIAAARALGQLTDGRRYRELEVPGGHLGVFAGRHSLATVPVAISAFLRVDAKKKPLQRVRRRGAT